MVITLSLIGVILGVVVLDQAVKWIVVCNMDLETQVIEIIDGFFRLRYIQNPGMSFGLFGEEGQRWVFMIISPIALVAIGVYLFKFSKDKLPMRLGLAFILGGGFSNMIDRIFYGESLLDGSAKLFDKTFFSELFDGRVVDMFDFYGIWNAIFNVADSFVCIGAAMVICTLIYDIITEKAKTKKEMTEKAVLLNQKMAGNKDGTVLPENDDLPNVKITINDNADEKSDVTKGQNSEAGDKE